MSLLAYYMTLPVATTLTTELLHTFPTGSYYGMGGSGNTLYIADYSGKVQRFDVSTSGALSAFAVTGAAVWCGVIGSELLVTIDDVNAPVRCYNPANGGLLRSFGSVHYSAGVVVYNSEYHVGDYHGANPAGGTGRIRVYNSSGVWQRDINAPGGQQARMLSVKGNVLYMCLSNNSVFRYDLDIKQQLAPLYPNPFQAGWHTWDAAGRFLSGVSAATTNSSLRLYTDNISKLAAHTISEAVTGVTMLGGQLYAVSMAGKLYKVNVN